MTGPRSWFRLPQRFGTAVPWVADTLGGMCRRVECRTCQRPTYAGCGAHIEQVLGDVEPSARCQCASRQEAPRNGPRSWLKSIRRG